MTADNLALEQQFEELLQFVYAMPIAIIKLNAAGDIEMLNPVAVQILAQVGIDSGTTNRRDLLEAIRLGLWNQWLASSGQIGLICGPERITLQPPNGKSYHLLLTMVRSDTSCTMISLDDITKTIEQEREINLQRRKIGLLIEHIHGYCVTLLDTNGYISEWNPSIERMLGRDPSMTIGVAFTELIDSSEQSTTFNELALRVREQGWCRIDVPMLHSSGNQLWTECVVTPIIETDSSTSAYVTVLRDATDQHRTSQKLISQALTDPLTGLHNRRGLQQLIPDLLAKLNSLQLPSSWIAVDIDHFKFVNDSYGHDAGDKVLQEVALLLRQTVRDDDLVVRIGGEEFLIFLPKANIEGAQIVAERMRQCIESSVIVYKDHTIKITSSFGISSQPPNLDWNTAIMTADIALYQAKHSGRNKVVISNNSEI